MTELTRYSISRRVYSVTKINRLHRAKIRENVRKQNGTANKIGNYHNSCNDDYVYWSTSQLISLNLLLIVRQELSTASIYLSDISVAGNALRSFMIVTLKTVSRAILIHKGRVSHCRIQPIGIVLDMTFSTPLLKHMTSTAR